jgi:hypothetical protein
VLTRVADEDCADLISPSARVEGIGEATKEACWQVESPSAKGIGEVSRMTLCFCNDTVKVLPAPGVLSTEIFPAMASTRSLAI